MVSAAQVGLFIAALLYYLMRKPKDSSTANADYKNDEDSSASDNFNKREKHD